MKIEFDPDKRLRTMRERGLDMEDAGLLFEERHITVEDGRTIDSESRYLTVGYLYGRMIFLAWTFSRP